MIKEERAKVQGAETESAEVQTGLVRSQLLGDEGSRCQCHAMRALTRPPRFLTPGVQGSGSLTRAVASLPWPVAIIRQLMAFRPAIVILEGWKHVDRRCQTKVLFN